MKKRSFTTPFGHLFLLLISISACQFLSSCSKTIHSYQKISLNSQKLLAFQELTAFKKDISPLNYVPTELNAGIARGNISPPTTKGLTAEVPYYSVSFPTRYATKLVKKAVITATTDECDEIVFYNGATLKAKVTEINTIEIKYKKCDNLDGPTYSIKKSEVKEVDYANGTTDTFANEQPSVQSSPERNVDGFGLAAFLMCLLGIIFLFINISIPILVAALILGLTSVIFGIVGLSRIHRRPDNLMGKGFGITSVILGILILLASIVVLAFI